MGSRPSGTFLNACEGAIGARTERRDQVSQSSVAGGTNEVGGDQAERRIVQGFRQVATWELPSVFLAWDQFLFHRTALPKTSIGLLFRLRLHPIARERPSPGELGLRRARRWRRLGLGDWVLTRSRMPGARSGTEYVYSSPKLVGEGCQD